MFHAFSHFLWNITERTVCSNKCTKQILVFFSFKNVQCDQLKITLKIPQRLRKFLCGIYILFNIYSGKIQVINLAGEQLIYTKLYKKEAVTLPLTYPGPIKGSVSRDLRWVLLYINGKLSLSPIIASQKILSLLKG